MSYKSILLSAFVSGLCACHPSNHVNLAPGEGTTSSAPSGNHVMEPDATTLEAGAFAGDAAILREALLTLYPSLDRFGQRDDVLSALEALDDVAADQVDALTFYRAVADVAASTKDEHVIPFPSERYRRWRRESQMMLPFTVQWVDGEPYVVAVADETRQFLVGRRVVAFDGHDAATVLATLRATIPSDGLSETFSMRRLQDFTPTQNENYFDLNYPIWFGARARYTLSVDVGDGRIEHHEMSALDWPSFQAFYRERLPRIAPVQFRWLEEDLGYLSVLSFHDRYYEAHGLDAETVFAQILGDLNARPGSTLVLDLRQNEGGGDISSLLLDFLLTEPFVEYDNVLTSFVGQPEAARHCANYQEVAFDPSWSEPGPDGLFQLTPQFRSLITGATVRSPRADAFQGPLIVLISGATGSAAVKVSGVLEREDRAIFVGEETGGAAAGATAFGYCRLELPTSDIALELPLVRFERQQDSPYGRGLLPDVYADWGLTPPVTREDIGLLAAQTLARRIADAAP